MEMKELAQKSKKASRELMKLTKETRDQIFNEIIMNLEKNRDNLISVNKLDLESAKKMNLSSAMIDRLELSSDRIDAMIAGVLEIKKQEEVVGKTIDEFKNAEGLTIRKQRVPLGVILMIFESRPNVVIDCAALAIKSSNSIILKGGKEANHSNKLLGEILKSSIEKYTNPDCVTVLQSDKRENVNDLLKLKDDIDVVIPRGGERLIHFVYENAQMPVIAHYKGLCHMYIDKYADIKKAVDLVENAKTQRPGVCNAIETLLIHQDILKDVAPAITNRLKSHGTELRVDQKFADITDGVFVKATDRDWSEEYLENILSIKTVDSIDSAIDHIAEFGSQHTECIVSDDFKRCDKFLSSVDASCVMINASTRFNDGGQLGLGAELGISTSKLHAYGPMGAEQMTTTRYVVEGAGHVRG